MRGPTGAELGGRLARADLQVAAHAGGEVDDDLGVRLADALDHLAIEGHVATRLAGGRIAHMGVHHGGAGAGCFQGGGGDLRRGNGNMGIAAYGITGAGQGAGDDDIGVHGVCPWALRA